MEDTDIIELFWSRSEQSIAELSKKYGRLLLHIAENILFTREDAEECINDSYLKVWNTIPPQKPQNLSAYIIKIVRNTSLDKYRYNNSGKRNENTLLTLSEMLECIPSFENPGESIEKEELTKIINSFLSQLDEESRLLFIRKYFYFDSFQSLSKKFDISEGNIRIKLHRIRGKLKNYLESRGVII